MPWLVNSASRRHKRCARPDEYLKAKTMNERRSPCARCDFVRSFEWTSRPKRRRTTTGSQIDSFLVILEWRRSIDASPIHLTEWREVHQRVPVSKSAWSSLSSLMAWLFLSLIDVRPSRQQKRTIINLPSVGSGEWQSGKSTSLDINPMLAEGEIWATFH